MPLGFKPRQARGQQARERVYEAAIAQFAEHGVAATRIEDVVASAGVAWGTFYRYFPRKEDVLLEAAVRQVRERLMPLVDADLADTSRGTREKALRFLIAMLEPEEHPLALHAAVIKQVVENRARFSAMLGTEDQPLLALAAQIIGQGQERGEVRTDIDRTTLAGTLLAGTAFTIMFAFFGDFREPRVAAAAPHLHEALERVFGIIWRGLEPVA